MNLERVLFGFVIILALAFTFAFVMGGIDNADHHNVWLLTIAILVNLIATGLKLGDRSQVGALLLASSLVVDVLLITARVVWVIQANQTALGPGPESMANIVSMAGGALVASIVSVVILVGDTLISRR
jgi:Ca2+/H+ antiporter, TMEM165/GDT1 family